MDVRCETNHLSEQKPLIKSSIGTATTDDSASVNSHSSSNSDTGSGAPVCVREMIKRYNTVATTAGPSAKITTPRRQSHTLLSSKSSYFGINKFGSQTSVRQYVSQIQETEGKSNTPSSTMSCNVCCNRKSGEYCCSNGLRRQSIRSLGNECDYVKICEQEPNNRNTRSLNNDREPTKRICPAFRPVYLQEKNMLQPKDSMSETNCQPLESSYQSKTTIAKTSSGVRITIDIFFDPEQNISATDVVGSRVETDIPESRILTEFQQQTLSACVPNAQILQN